MATYLEHKIRATVQTTDSSTTTCGSYTLPDECVAMVTAYVVAKRASSAESFARLDVGAFKRDSAGAAASVGGGGGNLIADSDIIGASAGLGTSSNDVRVTVTGIAATIDWTAFITIHLYTP